MRKIKKCFGLLLIVGAIGLTGCTNKTEVANIENNESSIVSEENKEKISEEEEKTTVRHGSKDDPIPLGESYTYKFAVPMYSADFENIVYGEATVKIIGKENNVISVDVNFDSCDYNASLALGKDILAGGYFSTVSENMVEKSLISSEIVTDLTTLNKFGIFNPIYPGGNATIYIEGSDAKYMVIHHNVYDTVDEIGNPDAIEKQEADGVKYTLNSYLTWFLLE